MHSGGIGALAMVALLCGACGGDERTIESEQGTLTVQEGEEGAVRFEAEDGRRFEVSPQGEAELPEGFPDDVPQLEGARTLMSSTLPGEGLMLMLQSDRDAEDVRSFYREALAGRDWSFDREASAAGQHMLTARKGDRELSVVIGARGDGTQVALRLKGE